VEELFPGKFLLPDKYKNNGSVNLVENAYDNSWVLELLGRPLTPVHETLRVTIHNFLDMGVIQYAN